MEQDFGGNSCSKTSGDTLGARLYGVTLGARLRGKSCEQDFGGNPWEQDVEQVDQKMDKVDKHFALIWRECRVHLTETLPGS